MTDADHLLDEVVARIREQHVPPLPRESLAARMDEVPKRRGGRRAVARPLRRMRSWRFAAVGAACGIALAAVWLVALFSGRPALALADVQEAVAATQTVRYRVLYFSEDPRYLARYSLKPGEPAVVRVIAAGDRARYEQPLGTVLISDDKTRRLMSIGTWQGITITPVYGDEGQRKRDDFRAMLRNIPEAAAKRLPDRKLDGRLVSEFLVRIGKRDYTVTVDPQTKLPIHMEVVTPKRPEQGESGLRVVYTDFVFDAPVDEALLSMVPEEGYRVKNHVPDNDQPQPPESMELVVSPEDGIGPVKFGTQAADIRRLLGQPDWQEDNRYAAGRTELGYVRRGFRLMASDDLGLYVIHCFKENVGGSGASLFQGRTKEGIAMGASPDDVIKVYGEPDARWDSTRLYYPKRGYDFEFRDKKLVSFRVMAPRPKHRDRGARQRLDREIRGERQEAIS